MWEISFGPAWEALPAFLSIRLVTGKNPVPAAKTDIIIGIAIHKAYLKTEWSERVKQTIFAQLNILEHNAYIFDLFFDMCEKVYTDILYNKSPLRL